MSNTPITAPLVEAQKTYEDEIPKGSVPAELKVVEAPTGERTLGVRVTNAWSGPSTGPTSNVGLIPGFKLSLDCRHTPQPVEIGEREAQHLGSKDFVFHSWMQVEDLFPSIATDFYLDPRALSVLRSRVASLSSEDHWIALNTDGFEFDRIPGDVIISFMYAESL